MWNFLKNFRARRVLKRVRKLLSDPNKWCQGAFARDKNSDHVESCSEFAVSWCLLGAINKEVGTSDDFSIYGSSAAKYLREKTGIRDIVLFNDHATHKQVLDLLDKAIRR